jgi:predicted XRE-type DNA-binding protein
MNDTQYITDIDWLESKLYFSFIDDLELRNQLTIRVKAAKSKREQTQKWLSDILEISLTKIKEIENGTCKDFNAINNYINFLGENMIIL